MDKTSNSTTVPTVSIGNLTIENVEGEARIKDVVLAKRLGFTEPKSIRKLIKRHAAALEQLGKRVTVSRLGVGGTAEVNYLNRKQAVFITAKSETEIATEVTIEIVKRFDDYENGTARRRTLRTRGHASSSSRRGGFQS